MTVTINGKPLGECSDDEIAKEYDAGIWIDAQEGLNEERASRIRAIEAEITRRPDYGKQWAD